jgi:hypothetical protein
LKVLLKVSFLNFLSAIFNSLFRKIVLKEKNNTNLNKNEKLLLQTMYKIRNNTLQHKQKKKQLKNIKYAKLNIKSLFENITTSR